MGGEVLQGSASRSSGAHSRSVLQDGKDRQYLMAQRLDTHSLLSVDSIIWGFAHLHNNRGRRFGISLWQMEETKSRIKWLNVFLLKNMSSCPLCKYCLNGKNLLQNKN